MEKTYFPFKLLITIHSASELPVADVFTSDPYIIAYLGDRIIGKTKVIKKNLNPVWNEMLPHQSLLHTNHELEFKVFDEDVGQDDDFLGFIKVDLKDIPSDGNTYLKKYPMTNAPKFKSKSFVEISFILARNDNVIQIQSKKVPNQELSFNNYVPEAVKTRVAAEPLWDISPPVIRSTVEEFLAEDENSALLSIPYIRDLLCDASIFLTDKLDHKYYLIEVLRAKLKLQNSTKLLLLTGETYQFTPIEENSIQINLSYDDSKFILLTFSNRFMIWSWVKWVRLAFDYWHGAIHKDRLPSWATGMVRSSFLSFFTFDGLIGAKKVSLDLNNPFVLKLGDEFMSIQTMCSLIISVDSYVPDSYTMDIQLNDNSIIDFQQYGLDGIDSKNEKVRRHRQDLEQEKEKQEDHKRLSIGRGRLLKSAFHAAKTISGKGVSLVKDTAFGVTSTAVNAAVGVTVGVTTNAVSAVRVISSGDPKKIIRGAQDRIIGVGQNLTSTLVAAPQSFFGKSSTFVSVRSRDGIFHFPFSADHAEMHYLDFDLNDLYKVTSADHRSLKETLHAIEKKYHLYPVPKSESLSLDCTLFHGVNTAPKVLGQSVLKVRKLINNKGKSDKLQQMDIAFGEPNNVEVTFTRVIGYSITVVGAKNLFLEIARQHQPSLLATANPTEALQALTNLFGAASQSGILVKCKIVSREGHSGYKTIGEDHKTHSVKLTSDPIWNHSFTLQTGQLFEDEFYVRLEFFIEDLTSSISIGGVFVPLEYFGNKEQEYSFPISRFRCAQQYYRFATLNHSHGYGEVMVKCKKIEEDFGPNGKYKVDLLTTVRESSLFNTSWYAEILPSSGIDLETTCVERALVTVLHDGLQLNEQESIAILEGRKTHSQSTDTNRPTEQWISAQVVSENAIREFVIEVYENERRTPYPPFNWSHSAYTRAHYSDLSYKRSYKISDLKSCPPPDHAEWIDDWQLDKYWINTGVDGWIYGFTFGSILSNYHKNVSYTTEKGCHARRRKWKRRARLLPDANIDISQVINSFGKATVIKNMDDSSEDINEELNHSSSSHALKTEQQSTRVPTNTAWRKTVANNPDHGILASCMEKSAEDAPIFIDWSEILSYSIVTPSIISLTFLVHRYFPEIDSFRGAEVEMFISNCNALEFQSLIEERIWCNKIRSSIKRLVNSGNIYGNRDAYESIKQRNTILSHSNSEKNIAIDDTILSITDESIPETEELSLGSETIKELDDQLIELQNLVAEINEANARQRAQTSIESPSLQYSKSIYNKQLYIQKLTLERRIIRLKLYIAGLFGSNLKGVHNYEENEIRLLMFQDFHRAKAITLDNDVSTANNRIEYLLDMAEMRIRDAALCGWKYRGNNLEKCLEILANGYFIEIVSILGKFFERNNDEAVDANTKGLISKIELVNTYMKHNDRLNIIIENSLRPYGLEANPPAELSLFLNFNVLISWYTTTLIYEMRSWVTKVLDAWKDIKRDVTGNASLYKFPIPWIPDRNNKTGSFFSNIPEDLIEALLNYLTYARINPENASHSFHSYIGQMDIKVCLAYANAFLLLSEGYLQGLTSKEFYKLTNEEELQEYYSFIASITNDTERIMKKNILNLSKFRPDLEFPCNNEDSDLSIEQTMNAYKKLQYLSLDQLSCLLYLFLFYEKTDLLFMNSLLDSWKLFIAQPRSIPATPLTPSHHDSSSERDRAPSTSAVKYFSFRKYIEYLEELIKGYSNFIEEELFSKLMNLLIMKLLVLFFNLILQLYQSGEYYEVEHSIILGLIADIHLLREKIPYLQSNYGGGDHVDSVASGEGSSSDEDIFMTLIILEKLIILLSHPISSPLIYTTITELVGIGKKTNSSEFAMALSNCIEMTLAIRGVNKFFSPAQIQAAAAAHAQSQGHTNTVTTIGSSMPTIMRPPTTPVHDNSNKSAGTTPTNTNKQPQQKRTSIFSYFTGGFHHEETPPAPPAASSSAPVTPTHPASPGDHSNAIRRESLTKTQQQRRPSNVPIDDDDDDEDARMKNEMEMLSLESEKETAVIACLDMLLEELRSFQPVGSETNRFKNSKKYQCSGFLPPILRVFSQKNSNNSKGLLFADLILSCLPNKQAQRETIAMNYFETILNGNSNGGAGSSSLGGSFSKITRSMKGGRRTSLMPSFFSSGGGLIGGSSSPLPKGAIKRETSIGGSGSQEDLSALSAGENEGGENNSTNHSNSNRLSTAVVTNTAQGSNNNKLPLFNPSDFPLYAAIDDGGEPYYIVTFYDLKLFNLFYIDMFGRPKPFFMISCQSFKSKTHSIETTDETIIEWKDDTPIQVPIYEITSSTIEIILQCYYESYLTQHFIGQISLYETAWACESPVTTARIRTRDHGY